MGRGREAWMPHTICWTEPRGARLKGWAWERLAGPIDIVYLAGQRGWKVRSDREQSVEEPVGGLEGTGRLAAMNPEP